MVSINPYSPVSASIQTEIAADLKTVWEVLTAIDRWPEWNPDIGWARLDGELKTGTRFRWKSGPGVITSTIIEVEPPGGIAWSGRIFGIRAVHVWLLSPGEGGTVVISEESWDGLLVRIFRRSMQRMLKQALVSGLSHLKTEAEKVTATTEHTRLQK